MDIYKKYINRDAKDKQLVNVGRLVAVCALLIALIAVKPLLGGLDQAFQIALSLISGLVPLRHFRARPGNLFVV